MTTATESTEPIIRIAGGAGAAEAAAIAAVIAQVVADQQADASKPEVRRRLNDWMLATRHDPFLPPRAPSRSQP